MKFHACASKYCFQLRYIFGNPLFLTRVFPVRVLYVEAAYGFGGSLTGLLHLFAALPPEIEPVLLTSFDPSVYIEMPRTLIHRVVDIPRRPPHPGHWLPGILQYYRYIVRPWATAVSQAIAEYQPDLIHANNSVTLNLGVGMAAFRLGVPALSHQKQFEYPEKLSRLAFRRSRFAHHIAMSDYLAAHMFELGLAKAKCIRIYDPVLGPTREVLALRKPNTIPTVAMHSMLVRWKGQHIFLAAVAKVRRRCTLPFRCVIAGGPPADDEEYLNELKSLALELGLEDFVEFRGHVRNVYEFLASIDVAVHAAIEPEAFGRVAAEAMLMELPNIVTMGGGPAEYVQNNVSGLNVPRGDVDAMADAIEALITSPETRQRMGQAAREYALREFSPAELANQTVALYRRLVDSANFSTR
jgi:glycosyltransferase involved in cell wall biosynthesis